MLSYRIIPSIIADSQEGMEERINNVKGFADWLQLDVMDGKFVPTRSLDFELKLPPGKRFEAHLMLSSPLEWIELNGAKVDTILFHIEPKIDVKKVIGAIEKIGKKPGIALNPETTVGQAKKFLPLVDECLVMTVEPGYYGAKFLPETLEKARELRSLNPEMDIEVDGSMNPDTIGLAKEAGANFFICGSFIQKAPSPKKAMERLQKLLESGRK